MPLTDAAAKNAKPREKAYKLSDAAGMYLEVMPTGAKYWRMKYRVGGKEKRLALGVYPAVPLAEARRQRDIARQKLAAGIDPGEAKKAEKRTLRLNAENSFEAVAREWHAKFSPALSENHAERNLRRFENHVFPFIGARPVGEVEPPELLQVLQRLEARGTIETAHRVRVLVGQVMRYAISTGRAARDISADLRDAVPPAPVAHHAAITDPEGVGNLLRAIEGYRGSFPVICALRLSPILFQRPGELRLAVWSEFDLDKAMWEIPSARMKRRKAAKITGQAHLVPLPRQAVQILSELRGLTGNGQYLFPNMRSASRPMSDNTVNAALRSMGYDGETMTGHGFRATARTILEEVLRVDPVVIEAQLAHTVKDPQGRAYNRTKHLDQRREMLQKWADYLDGLKNGPPTSAHNVTP